MSNGVVAALYAVASGNVSEISPVKDEPGGISMKARSPSSKSRVVESYQRTGTGMDRQFLVEKMRTIALFVR